MTHDSSHGVIAEGEHEGEHIPHDSQHAEGGHIAFVAIIPPGGATVSSLVRCDDVEACLREWQHHLPPAVGEFGKAVEQEDAGAAHILEACLQDVHAQAVDAVHITGADASGQNSWI